MHLASGSRDKTVRLWRVGLQTHRRPDEALLHVFRGHTESVRAVCFSPRGERLLSGGNDGAIKIWSFERRTEIATLNGAHSDWVRCVAFA
jgi:WD40 repeat protein